MYIHVYIILQEDQITDAEESNPVVLDSSSSDSDDSSFPVRVLSVKVSKLLIFRAYHRPKWLQYLLCVYVCYHSTTNVDPSNINAKIRAAIFQAFLSI